MDCRAEKEEGRQESTYERGVNASDVAHQPSVPPIFVRGEKEVKQSEEFNV